MRYKRRPAEEYAGVYENEMMRAVITNTGRALTAEFAIKPDIRANAAAELPPDIPAAPIAFLRGEHDHYMVTDGGLERSARILQPRRIRPGSPPSIWPVACSLENDPNHGGWRAANPRTYMPSAWSARRTRRQE